MSDRCIERVRLIGGPNSMLEITVLAGIPELRVRKLSISIGPIADDVKRKAPMDGTYLRIPAVSPAVFLWQGWGR